MAFGDLFKSKKQRERDQRKKKRRASRRVDNALRDIHTRINELKAKRDRDWSAARKYLQDGQKAAAARSLKACRATEVLMTRLDRKAWLWEQKVTNLGAAENDTEMAAALQEMVALTKIDPDTMEDTLEQVSFALDEQADVDSVLDREYAREMQGVEGDLVDQIPSIEDMEKMLEDEVAAEIGSGRKVGETETDPAVTDQIAEGRRRLKDLMSEKQEEEK